MRKQLDATARADFRRALAADLARRKPQPPAARPALIPSRQLPKPAKIEAAALARLMARAKPTPFVLEAPAVFAFRSRRCLDGWQFELADLMARSIVKAALKRIKASRPDWAAGQPPVVVTPYMSAAIGEPWQCRSCGGSFIATQEARFCSDVCRMRWNHQNKGALYACIVCGAPFRRVPQRGVAEPRFCSRSCAMTSQHRNGGVGPSRRRQEAAA
jgi:hypothetical protein